MVLENEPLPFFEYLPLALRGFALRACVLAGLALVIGFLVMAVRYGPITATRILGSTLSVTIREFFRFSPRRVFALAKLAVKEAFRRKVLVAFGLFALLLLFAGWFLDPENAEPAKLYLSFVMSSTLYLVLLLSIFLSTMSLPADFKSKTIYTVVTKPVHPGEIVLGRILGFSAVGTLLVLAMGLSSYVFVSRVFNHTHELTEADLHSVSPGSSVKVGETGETLGHKHDVTLDAQGNGWTSVSQGHRHHVTAEKQGDQIRYVVGPPEELLVARVPIYGSLRFHDRTGEPKEHGISVGKEWTYQSFIDGSPVPLAAAIWTFHVDPESFPDGLPLEMTIRVFRTYKGDVEKGLRGGLILKNPKTGRSAQPYIFRVKDAQLDRHFLARKQIDSTGQPIDIFRDLAVDGKIDVWLQCFEAEQYFGVAKADMYLRAEDASFELNFVKGYLGIWMSMILVTAFGVMFSTFLSAPVALLATAATMLFGFMTHLVINLANSVLVPEIVKREDLWYGGGPFEALIRIVRQENVSSPLPPGFMTETAQMLDKPALWLLRTIAEMLPNYKNFDNSEYVVHGFNIPTDLVLAQLVQTIGFLTIVFLAGYLFLKTREIAK
jgi:ABC-type transport system involved in multi-copper enzyme maturation permease subunit